jgi:phenylalanine-4-hydroxylase
MFHDTFGHVPLLTNQHFVDFLFELSKLGLDYIGNEIALELLSRVYWFTVEFGLIRENDELKIYGAGILSSPGETIYCLGDGPERSAFDVKDILATSFRKDVYQSHYFVIDNYEQLYNSIPQIDQQIKELISVVVD